MSGMSSLLEPDFSYLKYLHLHADWAKVEQRVLVDTVRLDDVTEVKKVDYLKIDIQGGELTVFQNATERLADCVVVHTEAMFVPMYVDQPLFSEIELFLRSQGFLVHRFEPLVKYMIAPMLINGDGHLGISQIAYADVVFIRDYSRLSLLDSEQLLKMCLILNDAYFSLDLVHRCLIEHDQRFGGEILSSLVF